MNKELQDHVWKHCLPKEFKEEVKKMYNGHILNDLDYGRNSALINLFGENLTSDAEGEDEMLTVSRNRLMDAFNSAKIIATSKMSSKILAGAADMCIKTFEDVFGSKCLPDIEPKPDGPKYKVGDKVRISCAFSSGEIWDSVLNGRVATIVGCYRESNNWIYCFEEPIRDFAEFWLEPCTEQETLHCPSSETECCIPVRVPKMDEQRLYIATHITAAIYANYDVAKCFESIEAIVQKAVETADALIARCKKE